VRQISPLFWERDLEAEDLDEYPGWILGRVLRRRRNDPDVEPRSPEIATK
jgi:hypothetical protein